MTDITLGERLRSRRKALNLSQEIVCDKTGIDLASLSRFENGKAEFLSFRSMCRIFDYLLTEDEEIIKIILDVAQREG